MGLWSDEKLRIMSWAFYALVRHVSLSYAMLR